MSYCRFSTEDHKSDVYIYEDVYLGLTVHIARSRYVIDRSKLPPPIPYSPETIEEFTARSHLVSKILNESEMIPIDNEHAGRTYSFNNIEDCIKLLEDLERQGFYVPKTAMAILREELKENNSE